MSISPALLPPCLAATLERGELPGADAIDVLDDAIGVIELDIASTTESARVDGLFGPEGFVLAPSDGGELMTGAIASVPLQLALLVGLSPRPVGEVVEIATGVRGGVDAALAAGDLPPEVAEVLSAPEPLRWKARATWPGEESAVQRQVAVIDGGLSGLLLCATVPDSDDLALMRCGSIDVWRALCSLLPYPSEIG